MRSLNFSIYQILPAALGSGIYSVEAERLLVRSRARQARKADNLFVICEPIISTIWDPQHFTTLQASTVFYRERFTALS
jgi:hypothetical protein